MPVAYVELDYPAQEDELLKFSQEHIGERAAAPKAVMILEKLPTTGVGKIHKPTLNLLEIQNVINHELSSEQINTKNIHIDTRIDKKYGNMTTVLVDVEKGSDKSVVIKYIEEKLSGYSFRYEVVFNE